MSEAKCEGRHTKEECADRSSGFEGVDERLPKYDG